MKWICTLAVGLCLLAAADGEAAIMNKTVTYEDNGVVLEGYLAWDDTLTGPLPGILVVHQWMGLSDNERMRCDMLAQLGYIALAADIYGKGVRPANTQEAQAEATKYYSDRKLFRGRLQAGLDTLKRQEGVDPDRTAVIGYCFGGGGALELARSGAAIKGAVSFHGNLATPLPAKKGDIKCPILANHGAVDPYVKFEEVRGFIDEMEAADVDYQLNIYGHAVHAFTQKGAGDDPSRGVAYNAKADRRSWQAMRDFLEAIF